jgi:hypothetical protein
VWPRRLRRQSQERLDQLMNCGEIERLTKQPSGGELHANDKALRESFMRLLPSPHFVVGANLPWVGYGTDIGASAWYPSGGLSSQPASLDLLASTFATLACEGISVVRTFLLCDLRSGARFDSSGIPTGLNDAVFLDIDALVATARQHHIQLMPVLLDFHLCGCTNIVNGVQLGGRSRLIEDPAARSALVNLVLRPIVEQYREEEVIVAWDVMNEPEWCLGIGPRTIDRVTFGALQAFLRQAVECVHESSSHPATVGSAGTFGLDLVRPLGLDIYQVHWYERFGWRTLERPVADLDLDDHPVILGEFGGRSASVARVLDTAKRAGYWGALVWSVLGGDAVSAYPPDLVAWARTDASAAGDTHGEGGIP